MTLESQEEDLVLTVLSVREITWCTSTTAPDPVTAVKKGKGRSSLSIISFETHVGDGLNPGKIIGCSVTWK